MPDFDLQPEHLDSVDRLRATIESRLNELSESNRIHKRKIFDLYTVFEITRHLNAVLESEILFDGILLACMGQLGVQGVAIAIPELYAPADLKVVKLKGTMPPNAAQAHFRQTGELVKLLLAEPVPHTFEQLSRRLSPASPDLHQLIALQTALVAPLVMKSRLEGLLLLTGKLSGSSFTEGDLEFLSILVNQLAVSVENARLFESEKRAYQQLRETQKQLIQVEKFAAIGELAAAFAHEVNNPLGIIKNYLTLIAQALNQKEPGREYVKIVQEEVDRIARIVRQFLDLYRPQSEQMSAVDPGTIVDETLRLVSRQMKESNIVIQKHMQTPLPHILASGEQLKQVLLNLLMNARDFMPAGGQIDISVVAINGSVEISIADTGCGIPEENLGKIFEPFFTTKNDSNGTGLGLSVCCSIVARHRGTIVASNRKPHGACFTITFPVLTERDFS